MKKKMLKHKKITPFLFLLIFLIGMPNVGYTQNQANRKSRKVNLIEISATVVNEQGETIRNAEVIIGEGATTLYTNNLGEFQAKMKPGDKFIVETRNFGCNRESKRYQDYIITCSIIFG